MGYNKTATNGFFFFKVEDETEIKKELNQHQNNAIARAQLTFPAKQTGITI